MITSWESNPTPSFPQEGSTPQEEVGRGECELTGPRQAPEDSPAVPKTPLCILRTDAWVQPLKSPRVLKPQDCVDDLEGTENLQIPVFKHFKLVPCQTRHQNC